MSRQVLNICELLASTVLPVKEFQCRTIHQTKESPLLFVTRLMHLVSSFPDCHYHGKRTYLWYLFSTCRERTKNIIQVLLCTIINQFWKRRTMKDGALLTTWKNRPLFPGTELYPKGYSELLKLVVVTVLSSRDCRALPAWAFVTKSSHCHKYHRQRETWIVSGSLSLFGSRGRQHYIHLLD